MNPSLGSSKTHFCQGEMKEASIQTRAHIKQACEEKNQGAYRIPQIPKLSNWLAHVACFKTNIDAYIEIFLYFRKHHRVPQHQVSIKLNCCLIKVDLFKHHIYMPIWAKKVINLPRRLGLNHNSQIGSSSSRAWKNQIKSENAWIVRFGRFADQEKHT